MSRTLQKKKKKKKKTKNKTDNDSPSRKHAYIILTPLNPLLYSKTGVYKGIQLFFLFLLKKTSIVGTR